MTQYVVKLVLQNLYVVLQLPLSPLAQVGAK